MHLIPNLPQHTQQIFHMGQKWLHTPFYKHNVTHIFFELNCELNLRSHFQLPILVHDFSSGYFYYFLGCKGIWVIFLAFEGIPITF